MNPASATLPVRFATSARPHAQSSQHTVARCAGRSKGCRPHHPTPFVEQRRAMHLTGGRDRLHRGRRDSRGRERLADGRACRGPPIFRILLHPPWCRAVCKGCSAVADPSRRPCSSISRARTPPVPRSRPRKAMFSPPSGRFAPPESCRSGRRLFRLRYPTPGALHSLLSPPRQGGTVLNAERTTLLGGTPAHVGRR